MMCACASVRSVSAAPEGGRGPNGTTDFFVVSDNRYFRVIILLAVVIVLNLPLPASMRIESTARDHFAPFQNVMWLLLHRGREAVTSVVRARRAVRRRRELEVRVATLQEEIRQLRALEAENRVLRRQVGFRERSRHRLVLGRVIGRGDATGWWQTARLNRGSVDGIAPNMAAITTEGLVGRTRHVSRHTCDVLLLTDPNCRVACKFARTEAFGIARGSGLAVNGDLELEMLSAAKPFRVEYIAKAHHILKGDKVVTSGLGGIFPEGLLIGRVTRAGLDESGLYRRAVVEPAADIGALRYIFIVTEAGHVPREPAAGPVDMPAGAAREDGEEGP